VHEVELYMLKQLKEEFAIAEAEEHKQSGARKKEKEQDPHAIRKVDSFKFDHYHCQDSNFELTSNPMSRFRNNSSNNNLPLLS